MIGTVGAFCVFVSIPEGEIRNYYQHGRSFLVGLVRWEKIYSIPTG